MLFFNKLFSCFFQSQKYQRTRNPTKITTEEGNGNPILVTDRVSKNWTKFHLELFLNELFRLYRETWDDLSWSGREEPRERSDWFPASRMRELSVSVMGETRSTSRNGCIGTCTGSRNCGDSCWFCHVEKKPSVCFRLWVSLCYNLY